MIRNELRNTTIASSETASLSDNVSEYIIGRTKYVVSLQFNDGNDETLEDVINRLIMKDIAKMSA